MEIKVGVRAEWDKLQTALVHTPGIETILGQVDPKGNYYEAPFSVHKAAQEHIKFVDTLRDEGIRVYTLREVLQNNEAKVRKEALQYVDYRHLEREWKISEKERNKNEISNAVNSQGIDDIITLILLTPTSRRRDKEINDRKDYPEFSQDTLLEPKSNMYFMRDQQIITDQGIIIGNMSNKVRKDETELSKLAFECLGITPKYGVKNGTLEGGDFIPAGNFALIGYGERTQFCTIEELLKNNAFGFDEVVAVKNPLGMDFMHLDTYFNILGDGLAVGCSEVFPNVTCKIYAKNDFGYGIVKNNSKPLEITLEAYLRKKDFNVIQCSRKDQKNYGINFLTLSDRKAVIRNYEYEFFSKLKNEKIDFVPIKLDYLTKGYGSAHCMTCSIYRQKINARMVA